MNEYHDWTLGTLRFFRRSGVASVNMICDESSNRFFKRFDKFLGGIKRIKLTEHCDKTT